MSADFAGGGRSRRRRLRARAGRVWEFARARENTFILVLAALLGLLGGLGSVVFRLLIRVVQRGAWGDWSYGLEVVGGLPWWWVVLAPTVGGLVVGPIVYFWAREARGHGIPEVMEAVALRSGIIRARTVIAKTLASAVTIGSGGSVGREGPIVQIGAALGSTLGQWTRVSGPQLRTLVGCGAAAGIAGTFNAPVAGALFAVEAILGDFALSAFSPIVISSVMATVVSRHYLGDFPAFAVPAHELVSVWELGPYMVLGLVSGGVALVFTSLIYGMDDRFERVPLPEWLRPALGGAVVGLIALSFPHVLGVGYEATSAALAGQLGLLTVAALIPVKMVATSVTLASGGSGGVFAPSLFLGAMTGSLVGGAANLWFPATTGSLGAYALVGMGAVVAGTTQAPITAILIIFEMTSDYKLILPLMTSCILATVVFARARDTSIYTEKLRRRGIDLFHGHELNLLRSLQTGDVMDEEVTAVSERTPLGELLDLLSRVPRSVYYVVDGQGHLSGLIRRAELQDALSHAELLGPVVVAGDLVTEEPTALQVEEPLDSVMRVFSRHQPEELPVVDREGRVVGTMTRRHVLEAYDRELMKRDMAAGLGGRLSATRTTEMPVGQGYVMAEVDAPPVLVGRTLAEANVRSRHGVQVLLVRRRAGDGEEQRSDVVPDSDTRIRAGDRLVLLGPEASVARFRR